MNLALDTLFAEPLDDLGIEHAPLHGIFAPRGSRDGVRHGVTAQFLENAAHYHQTYTNHAHFGALIANALESFQPALQVRVILDLGSGSGNSIIPLLDRYPEAFVVATDISAQLLAILRDELARRPQYRERVALVCMDASTDPYRSGAFDLAVGAAVLHHVIEPERVIRACERALRPRGGAIFFEPFELGHGLLRLAYTEIIEEAHRRGEESAAIAVLRHVCGDYAARLDDKNSPRLHDLDDKWMFSRTYFESLASEGDWAECRIQPIHGAESPLTDQTRIHLRLAGAAQSPALPEWAWQTLRRYESAFTRDGRRDLPLEAAIVLRRGDLVAGDSRDDTPPSGWWWNPAESGRGFFVDIRSDTVCIAACAYDQAGNPEWYAAGPARMGDEVMLPVPSPAWPIAQGTGRADRAPRTSTDTSVSLRFEDSHRAQLDWGGTRIVLQPQHLEHPGFAGAAWANLGGWWIEDTEAPGCAALVECLDDRVVAALLSPMDWCITVADCRGGRSYAGEWLAFHGGQPLGASYRAPPAARSLGPAQLVWPHVDCLLVTRPDGRRRLMRRFRTG